MGLRCRTDGGTYDIIIERGALSKLHQWMVLDRKVCIVTDDGVPAVYADTVACQCAQPLVITLPQGEGTKTLQNMELICRRMPEAGFGRRDCVVAVGGGVMGDLAGFAASCYMRGVDFYNIPTTVLSQVDSSIGGKTAVDLAGVKNIVGTFYQPKAVVIDPDVLKTLPRRQWANGLAEAVKMSVTSNEALFCRLEREDPMAIIDEVIEGALCIKRDVVEQDTKEKGLRQVLNFGHTLGHGIESAGQFSDLYHGECVALGMLAFCSQAVRERLVPVLQKVGLPTELCYRPEAVWEAISHDKKVTGDKVTVVWVDKIGAFELRSITLAQLKDMIS